MADTDFKPRGMIIEEPMHHPASVFDTLGALAETMAKIGELEGHKRKLINQYQQQMRDAENGFSAIVNRPEPADDSPEESVGFGRPRFGF